MPDTYAALLESSGSISASASPVAAAKAAAAKAKATAAAAAAAAAGGSRADGSTDAGSADGSGTDGLGRDRTRQFAEVKRKLKKRKQQQMQFKVVARLGQMLYDGPAGTGGSRKKFEQSLVEWVPDSVVPMCPDCGANFGFKIRKHHCRLCGGVMCKNCSEDLDASSGQTIHSAASLQGTKTLSCPPHFRVCKNCLRLCQGQKRLASVTSHPKHIGNKLAILFAFYLLFGGGWLITPSTGGGEKAPRQCSVSFCLVCVTAASWCLV